MTSDILWQKMRVEGQLRGHPVKWYESVDSTSSMALALAAGSVEAGTVIIADRQTKGRGRLGKSWASTGNAGLYFSIILRPGLRPEDLSKITIAAGLGISKAIDRTAGISTTIKWPNDILFNGLKLCGILTECCGVNLAAGPVVVVGVGVNVNTRQAGFPSELNDSATSLYLAAGRVFLRGEVLNCLLKELDEVLLKLEQGCFAEILEQWRAKDATYGKVLTWLTAQNKVISGVSYGPDDDGQLIIEDAAGCRHQVLSGDIRLQQKP